MRVLFLLGILFSAAASVAAVNVKLTPVVTQGVREPVDVVPFPGRPGEFLVVEQAGKILRLRGNAFDGEPFLNITQRVMSGGEMGLLSVAPSPAFEKNRLFYVNYTTNASGKLQTVIAEYKEGSIEEKRLIVFDQPFTNHNGGQLAFDSKGYLYIATGDGGSAGDPFGNGQNRNSWLGKILRIDVTKPDPKRGTLYSIPADNPFKDGVRPEVYAYGLRNPWRFSFDAKTGDLLTGDVGQNKLEEIDIVESGKNYGWNVREGSRCYKPATGCASAGLEPPLFEYPRNEGQSITGGFVYRGSAIASLAGAYVYADYVSRKIWALWFDRAAKKAIRNELLMESEIAVSSFGQTPEGEILVVAHEGAIYKLAPSTPSKN